MIVALVVLSLAILVCGVALVGACSLAEWIDRRYIARSARRR